MKFFFLTLIVVVAFSCKDNSIDSSTSPIPEYSQIDFEPSWSKTGNKIAYAHADRDNDISGIYTVNSNGTTTHQIVTGFARNPDWSPDSEWIVFSQGDQIFKIEGNGDSLVQLTNGGKNYYAKWSDDGNWISYSDCSGSQCNVWIMKPDGSQKTLIEMNANFPNWSAGSSILIYFKPVKNNNGNQIGDTLYQYDLNNGSRHVIAPLIDDDHIVNMYPVIRQSDVIFSSMNKAGYVYIYKMSLDGATITRLTDTQGYSPDFSAANLKIIYTNRNKGNGRLWIMDRNGNNKTQFTF